MEVHLKKNALQFRLTMFLKFHVFSDVFYYPFNEVISQNITAINGLFRPW